MQYHYNVLRVKNIYVFAILIVTLLLLWPSCFEQIYTIVTPQYLITIVHVGSDDSHS